MQSSSNPSYPNSLTNLFVNNASAVPQTQNTGAAGVQAFMQTPAYQLAYGNNTAADPNTRFQNDPGVQMAVQQGEIPLQNQAAAKGLGNGSGALAQALSQYMYNNYNTYTQGQSTMLNNYQNQLSGLVSAGNTASQNAAGAATTAATNNSNANLTTGSNISSLYANQGSLGASGYLNTGAATSNNLFNGMTFLAQLNQAQNASQNGQQSALAAGQGSMAGATGGGSL